MSTLQGLVDFAAVRSYLDTATKMGTRPTRRPPPAIHHRPMAAPSTRPRKIVSEVKCEKFAS